MIRINTIVLLCRMCILVLTFMCVVNAARADEAGKCQAAGGSYLTGTVTQMPRFVRGHFRDGIELSHTHVAVEADGQIYDVAIDNVFASGYDAAGETVPSALSSISIGQKLELCGELYQDSDVGIHWVHTNCGKPPTLTQPDGWVKILAADGRPGPNLEDDQEYCGLWP